MTSSVLGRVGLDAAELDRDLALLSRFPYQAGFYDEFTSGRWDKVALWNHSGDSDDTLFRDSTEPGHPTELLRKLPGIAKVLDNFSQETLTMVRARNVIDGTILPHRDFLELDQQYFRVMIVLDDNPNCFNSDEDKVFHMRQGEVWHLDAAGAHAAVNFSRDSRWSLCLDFLTGPNFTPTDIFADRAANRGQISAQLIERPTLGPNFPNAIDALSSIVSSINFRDLAFTLGKVHFKWNVPTRASWDWLCDISAKSGDSRLIEHSQAARDFFVGARKLGQRFSFVDW